MKRGPEIKMPKLEVPKFLADLYADLRDRRLLPLVALLVVAIIAVPLLLGGSSDSSEPSPVAMPSSSPGATQSAVVVTRSTPSLRDYRLRLRHLHAKDPFRPEPRQKAKEESEGGSGGGEAEATGEVETESSGSSGGPESGGTNSESTTIETESEITYFGFAADIRVTPVASAEGKPSDAEPYVRHNVLRLTSLPSDETPALTYMGPSQDGKKALMVVSSNVTSLFGDSACLIGSDSCQLLALKPGLPETVVWGNNGRTYKFELIKIKVLTSDQLKKTSASTKQKPDQG